MKRIVILICWIFPFCANAQKESGVSFKSYNSWQQLLEQAKVTNKKIFVDAYATWCGPCKQMDAFVYTDKNVADFLDSNFISVKVQMDQSQNDIDEIRRWYTDAIMIKDKFKIDALPSLI